MAEEVEGWRFLCEALVHISSLRMFLTSNSISPIRQCRGLAASLRFSSSLELVCEWENEGSKRMLHVPLPLFALDHSAPVQAAAREDHIEVKLRLLDAGLPLLRNALYGPRNSLNSEYGLKQRILIHNAGLAVALETNFYCRACKTKITKGGFKFVLELPSIDWRDVADHWFGNCCCGSSIRTESILARFEENVHPSQGKLLLGSTTCIVHFQDLSEGAVDIPESLIRDQSTRAREVENDKRLCHVEEAGNCVTEQLHVLHDSGADSCSTGECNGHVNKQEIFRASDKSSPTSYYDFLRGPAKPLSSGSWQPLRCCGCLSLVGACVTREDATEQAVHLLKRHISTSKSSTSDSFRYHTLQKDFINELLSQIEDNSSYRYIVRGLRLKKPMLQLVITNEESLIYSGVLGSPTTGDNLRRAINVMFCDCSSYEAHDIRSIEEWSAQQKADDIFMFEEEISMLLDDLHSNQKFFPDSFAVVQGLKVSFITS